MPFRQAYQFTSAKLMIFIGYQIIIRHFFPSYPKTFKYCFLPSSSLPSPLPSSSSLPPFLPTPVPGSFLPGSS